MRIAYITPGAGLPYYCQNCFRDIDLLKAFLALGHDIVKVPMYLPEGVQDPDIRHTPVFYGAINVYLKEKAALFRHAPPWLERFLDLPLFLQLAARKSGSTRPNGLEEMTLSMLRGEAGRQASELEHLIRHLRGEIRPDIVHLSNALLLGLAGRLKSELGVRLVCSLQDENEWVDLMEDSYRRRVWELMAERARPVDLFVTPSRYYAEKMQARLRLPEGRVKVIRGGLSVEKYEESPLPFDPPVLGYLCRMSPYFGMGILVDAFLGIKKNPQFRGLRLHLAGGYAAEDRPFVKRMRRKIAAAGFEKDVTFFEHFDQQGRIRFLKTLTLLSVPVPSGEAFGAYQAEALAAGVPVVQPEVGCYPEFVELTGGGVIYQPNESGRLAAAVTGLLEDPDRIRALAARGKAKVGEYFTISRSAGDFLEAYRALPVPAAPA